MKTKKLTGNESPLGNVLFACYFAFINIFVWIVLFLKWLKKTISRVPKAINDFFSVKLETIEGEIIEIGERNDVLLPYNLLSSSLTILTADQIQIIPQKIDLIHVYFLKIKNKVKVCTVKVSFSFYKKIKAQIKEGTTNISLSCEQDFFDENEYNFHF